MARRFSSRQRIALYLATAGRCALCGVSLGPDWHADHVQPYSRGGATDVLNGQALCPTCNLRKGDTVMKSWETLVAEMARIGKKLKLRPWQELAFREYQARNKRDFLLVATPGAGKTRAAVRIAYDLLFNGTVERVVVVCPTTHVKKQWAAAMGAVGIKIDPAFRNRAVKVADDYIGIAGTYAQIAEEAALHRSHCAVPTLVILDEVHHVGDQQSWGRKVEHAFESATRRLLLSGTPFRSDKMPIKWVEYDEIGLGYYRSRADFSWSYGQALHDGHCRPLIFPSYDGKMKWWSDNGTREATFRDELPEEEARYRLRTALDPKEEWLPTVLRAANQKLTEIRANGHPKAGGLVLCSFKEHAKDVARLLATIAGSDEITVVVSDEDGAPEQLSAFVDSHSRWLVAVRMVSEGVDIPRLRVGVYATAWITETFFRQACGRIVRMILNDEEPPQPIPEEQSAYFYVPRDPMLVTYMERIKEERDQELRETIAAAMQPSEDKPDTTRQEHLFMPLSAEAHTAEVFTATGTYEHQEWDFIDGLVAKYNLTDRRDKLAALVRELRVNVPPPQAPPSAAPAVELFGDPLYLQKNELRRLIKRLVSQVVGESGGKLTFAELHTEMNYIYGTKMEQATLDQLQRRVAYLQEMLRKRPYAR